MKFALLRSKKMIVFLHGKILLRYTKNLIFFPFLKNLVYFKQNMVLDEKKNIF